ncbi:MAG: hypothetical protein IPO83_04060 [Chitinophagaceae bacterium]|nr:hypothetical protein [Chitinophagaceae bacterium]
MSPLKEGYDYYINENGLFVFTEAYHLKRGFCCKSGCLHCPYGFNKQKQTSKSKPADTKSNPEVT